MIQPPARPMLGILYHAIGGFAAGSFYIPFKGVRGWAWESYWIVGGLFTWLILPWTIAVIATPRLLHVLGQAPRDSLLWTFLFGALWGVGNLSFGLSLRYLGVALGMAIALGSCALFGTIIPPLYDGTFRTLAGTSGGQAILAGLGVCLSGIACCTLAGRRRELESSSEARDRAISEANFARGIWVAAFAGLLSACFALAIQAGKPIAQTAVALGTSDLHRNSPVMAILFCGGFLTNCSWCVTLNFRNSTGGDYIDWSGVPLIRNYLYSALAGCIAYMEFLFYGMGTTQMGNYDFSSWTIHMAFIIVFSNLWGIWFDEWRGTSRGTRAINYLGISILIVSTIVVGYGNYLTAATNESIAY